MTTLLSLLSFIAHWASRPPRWIGLSVAWLTVALAVITLTVVIVRVVLQWGSIGLQESLTYLHALVIMLASAYTLSEDGHVRVDIFYRRFGPARKAWVNALGNILLLLPFALFTLVISWQYVCSSWAIRETSADAGGLPAIFLLKTLILANGFLLLLQALAELAKDLRTLTEQETL